MLKQQMKTLESFAFTLDSGGALPSLKIGFAKQGQTAAHVAFLHEDERQHLKHVHAFSALLTRLDADADHQAVASIRGATSLRSIPSETFDRALDEPRPLAATFFADQASLDNPLIHIAVKITTSAFFDLFGIGS